MAVVLESYTHSRSVILAHRLGASRSSRLSDPPSSSIQARSADPILILDDRSLVASRIVPHPPSTLRPARLAQRLAPRNNELASVARARAVCIVAVEYDLVQDQADHCWA
jgi:hypothetical protein